MLNMKKHVALLLGTALLLGACGPTDTSSSLGGNSTPPSSLTGGSETGGETHSSSQEGTSDSSSSLAPRTDILEQYRTSFNAVTEMTMSSGGDSQSGTSKIYYGPGNITMVLENPETDYRYANFMAVRDGKIYMQTIDEHAEIVESSGVDLADTPFDDPLGFYQGDIVEDGRYELDDPSLAADLVTILTMGSLAEATPTAASFVREGDTLKFEFAISHEATTSLTMNLTGVATFLSKEEETTYPLEVPQASDLSATIDDLLLSLMDGNYTLEVTTDGHKSALCLDDGKLYVEDGSTLEKHLYIATEEGTTVGRFDEGSGSFVYEYEMSDALRTILPDFDVDGRVFVEEEGVISILDGVVGVTDHFHIPVINASAASDFVLDIGEGTLSFPVLGGTATISDIGTTTLPVEPVIIEPSGWTNESGDVQEGISYFLGSLDVLPYWDTGYEWMSLIDFSYGDPVFGDIECGGVPSDEVEAALNSYAKTLRDAGFRQVDADEYENTLGFYAYDYVHELFFQITDTVYVELYAGEQILSSGVGISFNVAL